MTEPLQIAETEVAAGTRQRIEVPVSRLATETWLSMPVEVVHGSEPGPRIWLSAAVHGDEVNGVEIVRQVLRQLRPASLRGAMVAVPIVNVFGFLEQSRYLPDRRDLNRSFPGSKRGSLAARLANLFMHEIAGRCSHGIDLHTGAGHRSNLPQLRGNLRDHETRRCAEAFAPPVVMHAETRDGSLRQAAAKKGIHVLLYEAGEAQRLDEDAIRTGVDGVLRVLAALEMIDMEVPPPAGPVVEVADGTWVRARRGGILRTTVDLGDRVEAKQQLGVIADTFGDNAVTLKAPFAGLVIGKLNNPVVHQGDGLFHVARVVQEHQA